MTSTRLHQEPVKSGHRPPCFNLRTCGSGHAQCRELSSAPPRYDAKPARFASNQDSRKLCSGGVTCPGLIRCAGLEQHHHYDVYLIPPDKLLGLRNSKTSLYVLKSKQMTSTRLHQKPIKSGHRLY